jgi:hypothetical protein
MGGQQIEQLSPLQGIVGIAGGEQRGDVGGQALDVGDRRAGGDAGPGIGQLAADAIQLALQDPDGLLGSLDRQLGLQVVLDLLVGLPVQAFEPTLQVAGARRGGRGRAGGRQQRRPRHRQGGDQRDGDQERR